MESLLTTLIVPAAQAGSNPAFTTSSITSSYWEHPTQASMAMTVFPRYPSYDFPGATANLSEAFTRFHSGDATVDYGLNNHQILQASSTSRAAQPSQTSQIQRGWTLATDEGFNDFRLNGTALSQFNAKQVTASESTSSEGRNGHDPDESFGLDAQAVSKRYLLDVFPPVCPVAGVPVLTRTAASFDTTSMNTNRLFARFPSGTGTECFPRDVETFDLLAPFVFTGDEDYRGSNVESGLSGLTLAEARPPLQTALAQPSTAQGTVRGIRSWVPDIYHQPPACKYNFLVSCQEKRWRF